MVAVLGVLLSVRIEDSWSEGDHFHIGVGVVRPESARGRWVVDACEQLWAIAKVTPYHPQYALMAADLDASGRRFDRAAERYAFALHIADAPQTRFQGTQPMSAMRFSACRMTICTSSVRRILREAMATPSSVFQCLRATAIEASAERSLPARTCAPATGA
jgi:hypothetical protein